MVQANRVNEDIDCLNTSVLEMIIEKDKLLPIH